MWRGSWILIETADVAKPLERASRVMKAERLLTLYPSHDLQLNHFRCRNWLRTNPISAGILSSHLICFIVQPTSSPCEVRRIFIAVLIARICYNVEVQLWSCVSCEWIRLVYTSRMFVISLFVGCSLDRDRDFFFLLVFCALPFPSCQCPRALTWFFCPLNWIPPPSLHLQVAILGFVSKRIMVVQY